MGDVKCEHATLRPGCTSRLPLTGRKKADTVQWVNTAAVSGHTNAHGLQNIPETLHKETKQAARRANCLISRADLSSYSAFKGAAETQSDEAD